MFIRFTVNLVKREEFEFEKPIGLRKRNGESSWQIVGAGKS
jgi:BMFP domain-containing protein YqiC